eukprot:518470-Rhodomonas_salina.1
MVFTGQEWPNSEAHTPEDQGAMDLAATDQHSAESMTMTNAFGYQKNLHSHLFKASLSQQQEVSGYGADGKGLSLLCLSLTQIRASVAGDTGDNWIVETKQNDFHWMRGTSSSSFSPPLRSSSRC